jgi:hypothetical protein
MRVFGIPERGALGRGVIAGLGVLAVIGASPALALTISNVDPKPHTVTVTAGGDAKELTIEPDKNVEAECGSGCKIKLENGEIYEMKGGETLSIDGGVIFVDASPDANDKDLPDIDPDAEQPPH